ncbi:hypothetical protein BST81_23310 [Leptolyngbya sp. 'hensonii']|uniref:glycosyltransferase n=1 Tax=Leptolyngbya sp. 'hensonii' TaxID=1922337 RepID=UPI00094FC68E|nr:glycosyltransferase [Leptolyngbya sp. 'hensonii']OLP15992.1 hypothetical protein BST81_23310 [Leptolyngbya sp. 'hensonii']
MSTRPHVAIVHDCLCEYGDAEQVLEALHRLYPEAPVYTAFVDKRSLGTAADRFADWDLRPLTGSKSLLALVRYRSVYKACLPYLWERLDLSAFDLVISSSGNFLGKSVLTRTETLHISYCHTPPRYLWEASQHHLAHPAQHWCRHGLQTALRQYDFYAAQRVDRFVTNSQAVARRIGKYYRRTAEVIPPPVAIRGRGEAGDRYYLYMGPLVPEQRVDLAILACNQLNLPLWVIGEGREADRLRAIAGPTIQILSPQAIQDRVEVYANAKAFLYPCPDADFGIAPVEAMGHGIPVIACGRCGMREVVLDFRTGLLFQQPTVESLCQKIEAFERLRFSALACIERAEEFADTGFISKLEWFIAQALDDHRVKWTHPTGDV